MHTSPRRRAAVTLLVAAAVVVALRPGSAVASWATGGSGSGPGSAAAAQVVPVVSVTCAWSSTTKQVTATITWTKAAYARSTVTRISGTTRTTVATALAPSVDSTTDSAVVASPGAGKSLTVGPVTFEVLAFAGDTWNRTGSSGPRTFTYTTGAKSAPDTCTVS